MNKFFKEIVSELHNVTWPTRQHAIRISKITIWFTLASAFLLWLLDMFFSQAYKFIAQLNPRNNVPIERNIQTNSDSWAVVLSWAKVTISWSNLDNKDLNIDMPIINENKSEN